MLVRHLIHIEIDGGFIAHNRFLGFFVEHHDANPAIDRI
jgi:hypothetical protein